MSGDGSRQFNYGGPAGAAAAAATVNSVFFPPLNIDDYCGLVLNDIRLFLAILFEVKIYEIRSVRFTSIPARVVFHPNRKLRSKVYTQNIEALMQPYNHHQHYHTEAQILAATANGRQLGLTKELTRQFRVIQKYKTEREVLPV